MVTGLVCIWSIDSQAFANGRKREGGWGARVVETEREIGEDGEISLHGGDVKSRFSCTGNTHTHTLLLFSLTTHSQSAYPHLWEFHGISVIACLYLRNALSGLRALLISGGLDWLLSAEHTR